jgi:hypothetical protein
MCKKLVYLLLLVMFMIPASGCELSCRSESDAGDAIEDAVDDTGDAIEDTADEVGDAIEDAGD